MSVQKVKFSLDKSDGLTDTATPRACLKRESDKVRQTEGCGRGSEGLRRREDCSYFISEQIHWDNNEQMCLLLIFGTVDLQFFQTQTTGLSACTDEH